MPSNKKKRKLSIGAKLFLFALFFTIIPLLITATLIIYTYQDLVDTILAEEAVQIPESAREDLSEALSNAKVQAILTVFIVVILTLFSNLLMTRNITRPLQKLVKGTRELSKGNLDFRIQVKSQDELGTLAESFNGMAKEIDEMKTALEQSKEDLEKKVEERTKELQETANALEEAKTTLEIKVQARTKELEELNKRLDQQVKERTEELEKKVKELEKFREIAVGRELKMVELKKKIQELRDRPEEKKPA